MLHSLSELTERITLAKQTSGDRNCVSTALYIIGEREKDEYIPTKNIKIDISEDIDTLREIEDPRIGSLAVWSYRIAGVFNRRVMHMGVVTGLNPTVITHRPDRNEATSLVENQLCWQISEEYGREVKFYVPKNRL